MKKIFMWGFLILLLGAGVLQAQDYDLDIDIDLTESFETEEAVAPFSLYGYLVNFSTITLYTSGFRIEDADMGNTLYMRLKGDSEPGDALHFHFEASYTGSTGNQNPYTVYESFAVDHLWGSAAVGPLDLQFGKMPIAWGTGYAFNPTARTAASAFMETVSEETPGTIGLAPSVQLGPGLALQGYLAFQDRNHLTTTALSDGDFNNLPFGVKLQGAAGSFDLSAGFIKEVINSGSSYTRYYYLSGDFAGAVWNFGIYGEASLRFPGSGSSLSLDYSAYEPLDMLELAAGFDYTIPGIDVVSRVEYYHHGPGESSKDLYDNTKLLSGELMVQGEDYIFLHLERQLFNYLTISAGGMFNLNDFSGVIFPDISYELYSNFIVSFKGKAWRRSSVIRIS
ncbi:hypothetical protein ES705_35994 [subsurface metagenome]